MPKRKANVYATQSATANKLSISNGLAVNAAPESTCIMWLGGGVLCNSFKNSECRAARVQSESGNRAARKVS